MPTFGYWSLRGVSTCSISKYTIISYRCTRVEQHLKYIKKLYHFAFID